MNVQTIPSPLGPIRITADEDGVTSIFMGAPRRANRPSVLTEETARQLRAYFAGTLHTFDLPLAAAGTEFQRAVWDALREIPFGRTATYGQIATRVGYPAAARAVGDANRRNPIAIVVPCHRVIGASGALTGYAGGLERKQLLLEHEGVLIPA